MKIFRQLADFLYRLFNSIFYFTPILLANYRWRHKFLIPFYKGKAGGGRSDKHERAVVFMALNETTVSVTVCGVSCLSMRNANGRGDHSESSLSLCTWRIIWHRTNTTGGLGRMRLTGIWRRVTPAFFLPIITTHATVGSISYSRRC